MRRFSSETRVIIALSGIVLAFSIWASLAATQEPAELIPRRTTFNTLPGGCKAAFVTLRELRYGVARLRAPWTRLPDGARLLFALSPGIAPTEEEWEAVRYWVHGGGILVYAPPQGRQTSLPTAPEWIALYPRAGQAGRGSLTGVAALGVYRYPRPMERMPLLPQRLRIWKGAAPLVADGPRVAAAWAPYGKGGVLVLRAPEILSNEGVDQQGNLRFLLNLVDAVGASPGAPSGRVLFDEYHHGYGYSEQLSIWDHLPDTVRLAALQTGAAALLLLMALSRRRAAPIVPPRPERQRSEYLDSMASLLQRAGAVRLAARLRRRALGRRLARALGSAGAAPDALLARRRPELAAEAASLLHELEAWDEGSAADLLRAAQRETKLLEGV